MTYNNVDPILLCLWAKLTKFREVSVIFIQSALLDETESYFLWINLYLKPQYFRSQDYWYCVLLKPVQISIIVLKDGGGDVDQLQFRPESAGGDSRAWDSQSQPHCLLQRLEVRISNILYFSTLLGECFMEFMESLRSTYKLFRSRATGWRFC